MNYTDRYLWEEHSNSGGTECADTLKWEKSLAGNR